MKRKRFATIVAVCIVPCAGAWIGARLLISRGSRSLPAPTDMSSEPSWPTPVPTETPPVPIPPAVIRRARVVIPPGLRPTDVKPGLLILGGVVDEAGRLRDIEVSRSLQPAYDAAAVAALKEWNFTPGRVGTSPAKFCVGFTVRYDGPPHRLPTALTQITPHP